MVHRLSIPGDKDTPPPQRHADAVFFSDLTRWRERLARSIARNNLGMRSELIETAVNRIILSLIFLRIAEDRGFISKGLLRNMQASYQHDHELGPILRPSLALYWGEPGYGQKSEYDLGGLVVEDRVIMDIFSAITSEDNRYRLAAFPPGTLAQVFSRYLKKTIRRSATHQVGIVDTYDTMQTGESPPHHITAIEYMVTRSLEDVTKNRSAREILPIRLLDPSCGAGAVLLLSFQWLLENTGNRTPTFEECREVLAGSLHGLDINRHAVAVTRMLMVFSLFEHHPRQHSYDFLEISEQVFRDLTHTIRCGNALIDPEITHDESWMFCPPRERYALNTFNWKNGFPEISATGGFDAVVSIPPEGALEHREWIEQYFQRHYQVFHPLADRSAYFIEKGLSLLKPGGTLSCFMRNRWFRGSHGSPFRKLLNSRQIEEIVDSSLMTKGKHGIGSCILRLSNRYPAHPFRVTLADVSFSEKPADFRNADQFPVDQTLLDDGGWTLADTRVQQLLNKMNRNSLPLYDFVMGQVHAGTDTGPYDGFVIGDEDRKYLLDKDSRNKKLIRKLVNGRDITRYRTGSGGRSIIFIHEGWTKTHKDAIKNPWRWFKKQYPLIARLLKRPAGHEMIPAGHGDLWGEVPCTSDFWLRSKPRILFPAFFEKPSFAFDTGRSIADPTVMSIASSSLYLLGLLNSRLLAFVFSQTVSPQAPGRDLYSWDDIKNLPIYTPDFEIPEDVRRHSRLELLVKKMISYHQQIVKEQEKNRQMTILKRIEVTDMQIDGLVYELYGLNSADISVVEEFTVK